MIEAMIAGVKNPVKQAELAGRRIKASRKQLYDALHGRLTDHHRFLLRLYLNQYDASDAAIVEINRQVDASTTRMDEEAKAGQIKHQVALINTLFHVKGWTIRSPKCGRLRPPGLARSPNLSQIVLEPAAIRWMAIRDVSSTGLIACVSEEMRVQAHEWQA